MVYDKLKGMIADQLGVSEDEGQDRRRYGEVYRRKDVIRKRTRRFGGAPFPCISFRAKRRAKRNGRGKWTRARQL